MHQPAHREMRHQQAVKLLLDEFRRLAPQYDLRPAKVSLEFIEGCLSGKGLARCSAARFQPLPIRTAREVFPQAAQPVNLIERVMSPVDRQPLSRPSTGSGKRLDFPVPIQPQHVVEVFVTPSPPTNTRLSPPLPPRQQSADFHLGVVANLAKPWRSPKVLDAWGAS
jgi:hypothetical protein